MKTDTSSDRSASSGTVPAMRWHELKTDPAAFDAVADGNKTHEIRLDDRGFKVGDGLLLRRTRDTGWAMKNTGAPLFYTGDEYSAVITHILEGYGLLPGWVVLSIKPIASTYGAPVPRARLGADNEVHPSDEKES